ncbi:MAG: 30S ribosomal protein S12 methylthiotransferase RimO [Candidatus Gygaella obscura]|nr:30S ribosomal protein S12 methylthiotransferase RimO [Candidatus Gygaella obscura]
MSKRFNLISLGCPRNLVDSELVISRLVKKGFIFSNLESSRIVLVNTCAFIDQAKKESIEAILDLVELKKNKKIDKLIVFGCLVQRYKQELVHSLKGVDAFLGTLSIDDGHVLRGCFLMPFHYRYVKICEGCNNNCSYCAIPGIKGSLKSRSINSILREVNFLDRKDLKELILVGQDTTSYGKDLKKGVSLSKLLSELTSKLKNISWIRLLYLHPEHINDNLIAQIADNPRICKYIDLPIQHINDKILQKMNRRKSRHEIEKLIVKLRKKIKNVVIRTSLIVGFPTETEREFNELFEFVGSMKFERLGVFTYSQEEGTSAYSMKNQVESGIKKDRFRRIMQLQQSISKENNKKLINKKIKVLIDEIEDSLFIGRTQYDAPDIDGNVFIKTDKKLCVGDFIDCKIIDSYEYDLLGAC